MKNFKQKLTPMMAMEKMRKYCDYQERCHQEVRTKLLTLGVYGQNLEEIIAELIQEGCLNEERYARAYTRGKFRIKKWGRIKITHQLKAKHVSDYCIQAGLEEIDEEEYYEAIRYNINIAISMGHKSDFEISQYLMAKGFESGLINEALADIHRDAK